MIKHRRERPLIAVIADSEETQERNSDLTFSHSDIDPSTELSRCRSRSYV